jgi:Tfp pilus assembly protein PilF
MRLRALPFLLAVVLLSAGEDPFEAPQELQAFARQHTQNQMSVTGKVGALLRAFFAPPEEGGLGISYDNTFTRTPIEAWRDRKANCLSLTSLCVAACRSVGLEARYGESLRISRWRRAGTTIRYERHIVAVVPTGSIGQEIVADFLPEVRRNSQLVAALEPRRVMALFYSNRAVELLDEAKQQEAQQAALRSIQVDPKLGVGWNILGVVQRAQGQEAEAEHSFLRAIEADPRDGAPCGNLESLLKGQGRDAEAQVYRDRGLEVRKKDPFFNAFLAEEALADSHFEEAEKRIKQAIRLLSQEPDFHLIHARVCLALGKPKQAIKALEQARKWAMPEMQARFDAKLALLKGDKP